MADPPPGANPPSKREIAASEAATQPAPRIPWGAIVGIVVLTLVGFAMLAYAIYTLLSNGGTAAAPTQVVAGVTQFVIPTVTTAPTLAPPTAAPATVTPTTGGPVLSVNGPANVRSGPSLIYPIIGGLQPGTPVNVIGRDSTGTWYVIDYPPGTGNHGWVSNLVATYTGDTNSLLVYAAPPTPPPTKAPPTSAPPAAATNPPAASGYTSHGIVGNSFSIDSTTVGIGQDIWFRFKVTNTSGGKVSFAVLSIHSDTGPNGESWTNATLDPGQLLEWSDHININTPGTYQFYLGICYGDKNACVNNAVTWDRLSNTITVTVQ